MSAAETQRRRGLCPHRDSRMEVNLRIGSAFSALQRLGGRSIVSYFTHGLTLAYRSYGMGPMPIVAFHGFGRTGEDFAVLAPWLGEHYTLHAFDLP